MTDREKPENEALKQEIIRLRKELGMKDELLEAGYAKAIARYELNLTKGTIEDEIVLETPNGPYKLMESLGLQPPCGIDQLFTPLVSTNVETEYRYWVTRFFSREFMLDYYNKGLGEVTFEYRRREDAPGPLYLRQTILIAKDPFTGEIIGKGNAKDVTNRYRMQGTISRKDEEVAHAAILQSISEIYYLTYYIDIVDKAYVPLATRDEVDIAATGYPDMQEAIYALCGHFVLPESQAEVRKFYDLGTLQERMRGKTLISIEFETSSIGWVRASFITADHLKNGEVAAVIAAIQEINQEKRAELENKRTLEQALIRAEDASRAKSTFLFNMSHDIRTPMNAIMGFTNIAKKNRANPEKLLDSLEKIEQAGDLLLSLINSILDMSRIESGKVKLDEDPGDIYDSFVSIESTLQELADSKHITLHFDYGEIRDRFVFWDHNRCMRIFINIITNAIKYSKEGGWVKVFCEQVGEAKDGYGTYRYTFADNGIGMSSEFQQHVFEEFSREANTTASGVQGTGLGLTVCKSFTELMNGTIEFHSEQGVGTTFTVTLPFRLRNIGDAAENSGSSVCSAEEASQPHRFSGKRVLLVEDNELNREIAEDILAEEGMIIDTAENGAVAVRMLQDKGPAAYDFILMDIQMPVMDGYEATKTIRKMYPGSGLPIIAVSANAFAEDKAASFAAGMDGHIAKPVNLPELFAFLDQCL